MPVQRVIRKSFFNVSIDRDSGQDLHFSITATGAVPTFLFASRDEEYFRASDFTGHPKTKYSRKWPHSATVIPTKTGIYSLTFGFLGATAYTLLATLRGPGGTTLKTIKDIDYERESQEDMFAELFRITMLS